MVSFIRSKVQYNTTATATSTFHLPTVRFYCYRRGDWILLRGSGVERVRGRSRMRDGDFVVLKFAFLGFTGIGVAF